MKIHDSVVEVASAGCGAVIAGFVLFCIITGFLGGLALGFWLMRLALGA